MFISIEYVYNTAARTALGVGSTFVAWSIVLLSLLSISGCASSPLSSGDDEKLIARILYESTKLENAILSRDVAIIDSRALAHLERHFIRADDLLRAFQAREEKSTAHDPYKLRRKDLMKHTFSLTPRLAIAKLRSASATAFPTGTIIFSKTLAESFTPTETDTDPLLLAIFVHELAHVRDGHALNQWQTASARRSFLSTLALVTASDILSIFLPGAFEFQSPLGQTSTSASSLTTLSEFAADLAVSSILEKESISVRPYLEYLGVAIGSGSAAMTKSTKQLLRDRAECLALGLQNEFPKGMHDISLGDISAGDRFSIIWSISSSYELLENLRNDQITPPESKVFAMGLARRSFQLHCAIARTFASASVRESKLVVPSFDFRALFKYVRWPE